MLGFILVAFIVLGFLVLKKLSELTEGRKETETLTEWLRTMQQSLDSTRKTVDEALRSTTQSITTTLQKDSKTISERLDKAASAFSSLQKEMGKFSEIGRSMRDLQEFLQSPKLRGNIGEQVLKEILDQILPRQAFHLQYSFKSGATVDAAIKTTSGIIPVDSKFPLENFRKMMAAESEKEKKKLRHAFGIDVRKHVRDIASKYILTEEGTIDYALMYIPSESVYYEVVNDPELFDYAGKRRVLPVSPMTFYAYLKAILMSFEGQKVEARARRILQAIRAIQRDYSKVEDNLSTLGRHITNAYNQMANVLSAFSLLGQKLTSTRTLGEGEEEMEQLGIGEK